MLEGIIYAAVAAFALIGILAVLYYVAIRFLHPKGYGKYVILIPASSSKRDVSSMLYAAKMRVDAFGDFCNGKIIAVDMGISKEERQLCEDLCRESEGIYFCKDTELLELISRNDL